MGASTSRNTFSKMFGDVPRLGRPLQSWVPRGQVVSTRGLVYPLDHGRNHSRRIQHKGYPTDSHPHIEPDPTETSLFQILSGRLPRQTLLQQEGDLYFGDVKVDPRDRDQRRLFAYVAQEDSLHEASTAREALAFSAKLRLPQTTTQEKIEELVQKMLNDLGMESAADTVIGGGFKKGISGGERRRVSIGLELVASPSVILLDEPTSGLDSFAASQVMKLLGDVAKAGNTVLFTIHQPSSKIFCSFDRLIILKDGQVMHQGAVLSIEDEFTDAGYSCPRNYNLADWVIDVAESNDMETLKKSFFREEPDENRVLEKEESKLVIPCRNHVSPWREFVLLEEREFRAMMRNPGLTIVNVLLTSVLSFIFGVMFWNIGRTDRSDLTVCSPNFVSGVLTLCVRLITFARCLRLCKVYWGRLSIFLFLR